jgi:hypothetical protein
MAVMDTPAPPKNPRADGFGYNPRCIKRDISNYLTQRDATTAKIAALITTSKTIGRDRVCMERGTSLWREILGVVSLLFTTLGAQANTPIRFLHLAWRSVLLLASCHG